MYTSVPKRASEIVEGKGGLYYLHEVLFSGARSIEFTTKNVIANVIRLCSVIIRYISAKVYAYTEFFLTV